MEIAGFTQLWMVVQITYQLMYDVTWISDIHVDIHPNTPCDSDPRSESGMEIAGFTQMHDITCFCVLCIVFVLCMAEVSRQYAMCMVDCTT